MTSRVEEDWLQAMNRMQKRTEEQSEIFDHIVLSIAVPAGYATLRDHGEVVAQAYGVIHDDLMCCESVITSETARGKGVGRRLMSALYAWAAAQGASWRLPAGRGQQQGRPCALRRPRHEDRAVALPLPPPAVAVANAHTTANTQSLFPVGSRIYAA